VTDGTAALQKFPEELMWVNPNLRNPRIIKEFKKRSVFLKDTFTECPPVQIGL